MDNKITFSPPEEIEKKRAIEYMALSPTEKYNELMKLIKLNYQIRMSNISLKHPPNKTSMDIEVVDVWKYLHLNEAYFTI